MRHVDIGILDTPVIVFGGPYSNLAATRALLEQARRVGARTICTGDVVAYCGHPAETVAMVRDADCVVIAGNCEVQLANGAPDCGCGFAAGSTCDLMSAGWYGFANARITPDARAWMGLLPDLVTFTHHGHRHGVLHGGVRDVARFLWPTSPDADFQDEWDAFEAVAGAVDTIWAGHSGIPFERDLPKGNWINAGVIGMPPHDGQPLTRYAVLDSGRVRIATLEYDAQAEAAAMVKAGLTQGYAPALTSGYWPSEDILPPRLRVSALANG